MARTPPGAPMPPPPPMHDGLGMGFHHGFNQTPPMDMPNTHMFPQQQSLQPLLGAQMGHLDAWVLTPASSGKSRWQTVNKAHVTKSQTELNKITREDASKGSPVEAFMAGEGIQGMKREHITRLLQARIASEPDMRFSWQLESIKLTTRNEQGVIGTLLNPKLETTQMRIVMKKVLNGMSPHPGAFPHRGFAPQDHMQPQGPLPGPHQFARPGPQHHGPMHHPPSPGGMPAEMHRGSPELFHGREEPPIVGVPERGGFSPGAMAGGGGKKNKGPSHDDDLPPGMVHLGDGHGGGGGKKKGNKSKNHESDDDYIPKRKSSHGRKSPRIFIPDRPAEPSFSSDSDDIYDSDGNGSLRNSPITSVSGDSLFSSAGKRGSKSKGSYGGNKGSGSNRRYSREEPDYRQHGSHRPHRRSGRRDSLHDGDWEMVHKGSRESSPLSRKGGLDTLSYAELMEMKANELRQDNEYRRLQDVERALTKKRDQDRERNFDLKMAHMMGKIEVLQQDRESRAGYYDRPRASRAYTDRLPYMEEPRGPRYTRRHRDSLYFDDLLD